jgi:D-arabinose 1-dehydrogenase-like Zn-dependent alcohol dehydrogenase
MLTVDAYAVNGPSVPLGRTKIQHRVLGPHDVLIEIKYSGICPTGHGRRVGPGLRTAAKECES